MNHYKDEQLKKTKSMQQREYSEARSQVSRFRGKIYIMG